MTPHFSYRGIDTPIIEGFREQLWQWLHPKAINRHLQRRKEGILTKKLIHRVFDVPTFLSSKVLSLVL